MDNWGISLINSDNTSETLGYEVHYEGAASASMFDVAQEYLTN